MNVIVPLSCGACPELVEGREKGIQGMRALNQKRKKGTSKPIQKRAKELRKDQTGLAI